MGQVHIEQMGVLEGRVKLGETAIFGMRDHSFGPRKWGNWRRHFWISGGAQGGFGLTVTAIRYTMLGEGQQMVAGFVYSGDGEVETIAHCSSIDEISKDVLWPHEGTIVICTASGRIHNVRFERTGCFPYEMDDGTYMMREGIGRVWLDESPGLGMLEFGFNSAEFRDRVVDMSSCNKRYLPVI